METIRNGTETIGTDSVVLSEAKEGVIRREAIFIVNTSTGGQVISLAIGGQDAIAGSGIVISAGGFYQESADSGYIPNQQRITAVSSLAGATISIFERIKNGI